MEPLEIRCVLGEPELRAVFQDGARRSAAPKVALIVAVLWTLFGVVGMIRGQIKGSAAERWAAAFGVPLLLGLWIPSFLWRQPRKRARFMAAHSPNLEAAVRISDAEVEFAGKAGRSAFPWKAFRSWRELPELLLLHHPNGATFMIPKRAFATPADLERVRALFEGELGAPLP